MTEREHLLIPDTYTPTPILHDIVTATVVDAFSADLDATVWVVSRESDLEAVQQRSRSAVGQPHLSWDGLLAAGWKDTARSVIVVPQDSHPLVVVNAGPPDEVTSDILRDCAAVGLRALTATATRVGIGCSVVLPRSPERAAQVVTEGAWLARYSYRGLKAESTTQPLALLELLFPGHVPADLQRGADEGVVLARTAAVCRDLANTPPGYLTPEVLADVAVRLGEQFGFGVTTYGRKELIDLGCGGLLGVNAGSVEEPRLIQLSYAPVGESHGHLGLVGKGITYDSGGISLKPSDPMHLLMKMDMAGAAAILGAFTGFRDAGASIEVSAWLLCTENLPSGSAYKLGDVLRARNGKTVEVKNTDAEGRLVLMDGLSLAAESSVDAVIDIATLTGAAMRALGTSMGAVLGNDQAIVDRVIDAGAEVDEPVWQLPLERSYRSELDSHIADIANLGGANAGAITAALFLEEFVGDKRWAHIDIAGPMSADSDHEWRSVGATGFGARLIHQLVMDHRS